MCQLSKNVAIVINMQLEITRRCAFFLILIINILYSNCQSSFFMVHNIEKNEYYCITDSTYALSWLDDEERLLESERSKLRQLK
jgi:hypothetical protein